MPNLIMDLWENRNMHCTIIPRETRGNVTFIQCELKHVEEKYNFETKEYFVVKDFGALHLRVEPTGLEDQVEVKDVTLLVGKDATPDDQHGLEIMQRVFVNKKYLTLTKDYLQLFISPDELGRAAREILGI